jgi:hypothetical protein
MKNPEIDIRELAQRIWDIDPYEMKNNDTTAEDIEKDIINSPTDIINYLLDIIDDLQA